MAVTMSGDAAYVVKLCARHHG